MFADLSATDSFKSAASIWLCVDECPGAGDGYLYAQKNKYNEDSSDNRNV